MDWSILIVWLASHIVAFSLGYMRAKKFGLKLMAAQMTVVARKMGRRPEDLLMSIHAEVRKEMHGRDC